MSITTSHDGSTDVAGLISKFVPSVLTKSITKLKEGIFVDKESVADDHLSLQPSTDDGTDPMTLEGTLYYRKGGTKKVFAWKRLYVVLDMADGGSVSCFKIEKDDFNVLRKMYTKLNRGVTGGSTSGDEATTGPSRESDVCLYIPPDVPWVVKDVRMDSHMFCVEIPIDACDYVQEEEEEEEEEDEYEGAASAVSTTSSSAVEQQEAEDTLTPLPDDATSSIMNETALEIQLADTLHDDIIEARRQSKKRLRFYFRCSRSDNEKALWLRAFSKLDRMSDKPSMKGKIVGSITQAIKGNVRIRTENSATFARETRQLERMFSTQMLSPTAAEEVAPDGGGKEFRVVPTYAYPHRWMTAAELDEEMLMPSSHFHDLRLPSKRGEEIGTLKVEVLQCLGLPKLDRVSETDAVVYLVCGGYAFATDVILDCRSPMWLRKSRRACIFPIFHAYARLFAGVFDDDGPTAKDDFAGRVVLDIARLRPGCQYDVTLPLRMSSHVYSRRKRGAIRLRFELVWTSERAAMLSYFPKKMPKKLRPTEDVTIACADETSFRNVAITVHGTHLPGRFSPKQFKAQLREVNFTRKMVIITLRTQFKDTVMWKNPVISLFVFCAWMHCIYKNQVALAPVYIVSFVLLHMIRNYAVYGMDGPANLGFVPLSYEEMMGALMERNDHCFEPLELKQSVIAGRRNSVSLGDGDVMSTDGGVEYTVQTHKPKGKRIFRWLGFLPQEEDLSPQKAMDDQLEFPFSNGKDYPKYKVEDSLVDRPGRAKKEEKLSPSKRFGSRLKRNTTKMPSNVVVPMEFDINDGLMFEDEALVSTMMEDNWNDGRDSGIPRNGSGDMMEEAYDTFSNYEMSIGKSFSNDESDAVASQQQQQQQPASPKSIKLPQQDIDRAGGGNDKTLTEDLEETREKTHDLTFHLFDDKSYVIKEPDAVYFGQARKAGQKKSSSRDTSQQLDKLLGLGAYSNGNLLVSKVAPYVEPIIGSINGFLGLFRALFNIFTWRDPILSFWVSLLLFALILVLLFFPWRIVLFVVGIVVVGPQNWIYRLMKERKDEVQEIVAGNGEPNSEPPSPTASALEEEPVDETNDERDQQPILKAHAEPNQRLEELDPNQVDMREIHHVVVPYSQLKYQRMYDWPPEPQYAQVKIPKGQPATSTPRRKSTFTSSEMMAAESSMASRRRGRMVSREFNPRRTSMVTLSRSPNSPTSRKKQQ